MQGLRLFLFLGFSVSHPVLAAGLETAFDQGLLFKVTKTSYPDSYIMGTIHSGDPRVLALSETVKASLAAASQYVMEVALEDKAVISSLGKLWMLDGSRLSEVIDANLYAQVVSVGRQSGMPESTFAFMKPWAVMVMFSLPPGDYDNILDISLMKMAIQQEKKIIGLESVLEQLDVFDKMSIDDQILLLQRTLKNFPFLSNQYEELLQAYLEKDLGKLESISQQQEVDMDVQLVKRLMKRLIVDRNRRMLERLMPELALKSNFVAIGALHLPGESGLLNLLQNEGFEITRLD
jgi:uncharacterized protein YbaP (TraB family)